MDNNFSTPDPAMEQLTALATIWTQPTRTFTMLLQYEPDIYIYTLAFLGGITRAITRYIGQGTNDTMSIPAALLFAVIFGGISGLVVLTIYAGLVSWTGTWLGGKASPNQCKIILAWAMLPSISSLFLLIPEFFFFGDGLFRNTASTDVDMLFPFYLAEIVLGIWTLILYVQGLALAQGFGIGKTLLNIFLSGIVIIACIMAVSFFFATVKDLL